jgi:hypothetical protein
MPSGMALLENRIHHLKEHGKDSGSKHLPTRRRYSACTFHEVV